MNIEITVTVQLTATDPIAAYEALDRFFLVKDSPVLGYQTKGITVEDYSLTDEEMEQVIQRAEI
jgi:hypothetical protein